MEVFRPVTGVTNPIAVFGAAHSANALSMGIQIVLLSWLAAGVLRLPADQIAWVQAAVFLPNLLLLLMAGAVSDRIAAPLVSVTANTFLALTHGSAFLIIRFGELGFPELVGYAMALGSGNAFVQAAREKLVVQMGTQRVRQTISAMGICQFLAQAIGMGLAAFNDWWGAQVLLGIQALACLASAIIYGVLHRRLRTEDEHLQSTATTILAAIHESLRAVSINRPLRQVLVLAGFNGLMHLGLFIVVVPVIARDVMAFGSLEYGALQLLFILGTVLAHGLILRRNVRYPGQNILFCLLYSGFVGFAMAAGPTVAGLYALILVWGIIAGVSANLSRLVVHSITPVESRGRIMALYQFVLVGAAPAGALLAGYIVKHGSVWLALKIMGGASVTLFGLFLLSRSLWSVSVADTASS